MPPLAFLIWLAGLAQLSVLIASALVPFRLNWREEFVGLKRLHRQMYWTYGGYVVLAIIAFGTLCLTCSEELASGSRLARVLAGAGFIDPGSPKRQLALGAASALALALAAFVCSPDLRRALRR